MHELLDQLQQWIHDVRAEIPSPDPTTTPSDEHDPTEMAPTHTLPLVNLGTALAKLRTPQLPEYELPPVKSQEEVARELAVQRLEGWIADITRLGADNPAQWQRHKRLLEPFVKTGYGTEAAAAMEVLIGRAKSLGIDYNRDRKAFYAAVKPESEQEATGHPY